ncbi:hypothetical protein D9M09_17770 [Janthinobacterium agaricidamnosum]|uniref:Uncharacterized protein n=1 Tax=Janthinobacterium agaricidamnosum TaxID=55508 RepID=A0A3G2ECW9_9BURK|nr:hypothetical protein D9M09_17770 [Janthinobacterium agaricidamnosum]
MDGGEEGPGHMRRSRQVGKPYFTGWAASGSRKQVRSAPETGAQDTMYKMLTYMCIFLRQKN